MERDRERPIPRAVCEKWETPTVSADILKSGAPGEIRTPDPLLRRQLLYPAELRARRLYYNSSADLFEPDLSSSRRFAVWNLNGFGLGGSDFKF
jgi:hypothetical protein